MVANKKGRSWTVSIYLKHTGASFSPSSVDSLCLQITQMPRSPDLVIFALMTDNRRQTQPITLLLAHVHRVIKGEILYIHVGICFTSN